MFIIEIKVIRTVFFSFCFQVPVNGVRRIWTLILRAAAMKVSYDVRIIIIFIIMWSIYDSMWSESIMVV